METITNIGKQQGRSVDRSNVTTGRAISAGTPSLTKVEAGEKLCAMAASQTAVTIVDSDPVFGFDSDNGRPVKLVTKTFSDDTITETYTYQDTGLPMTDSDKFTAVEAAQDQLSTGRTVMAATFVDDTDIQHGRYIPLLQTWPVANGVADLASSVYWDTSQVPNVDVTAIVSTGSWVIDIAPKRLTVGYEEFQITADTPLPNIPATARYAEIYYNAQDGNVLWTVGGSSVTDGFSEDENGGVTVRITGQDNILAYLGSSADGSGALDGVAARNASVRYENRTPDEESA